MRNARLLPRKLEEGRTGIVRRVVNVELINLDRVLGVGEIEVPIRTPRSGAGRHRREGSRRGGIRMHRDQVTGIGRVFAGQDPRGVFQGRLRRSCRSEAAASSSGAYDVAADQRRKILSRRSRNQTG
jgi:hypothetical protein